MALLVSLAQPTDTGERGGEGATGGNQLVQYEPVSLWSVHVGVTLIFVRQDFGALRRARPFWYPFGLFPDFSVSFYMAEDGVDMIFLYIAALCVCTVKRRLERLLLSCDFSLSL